MKCVLLYSFTVNNIQGKLSIEKFLLCMHQKFYAKELYMIGLVEVVVKQTCNLSCMFGTYTEQISQCAAHPWILFSHTTASTHILWGFYCRSNFAKVYKINKQAHDHAIITARSQLIFCTRLYKSAKPFRIAWNQRLLSERCWYNNKQWLVDQTKATLISLYEKQVNITWPWVFATLSKT